MGAAVLNALNWLGIKNMTLHWLQAKNCVSAAREVPLPEVDESDDDDTVVVACIQELDEFITRKLRRYPLDALAVVAGTYLEGLLAALFDESQCTADEVRELLRGIESAVLDPQRRA